MWNIGRTEKQKMGVIGEDLACRYLAKRGYSIQERNYRKKWGEIDIIAQKSGVLHFIEVKSVSREMIPKASSKLNSATDEYRPEENVHPKKIARLHRVIQSYLGEERKGEVEWQLDLVIVYIDTKGKRAKIETIENIN